MTEPFIVFDEASLITSRMERFAIRHARQQRAKGGWWNWYANRGRIAIHITGDAWRVNSRAVERMTRSELRRVSWRRAH